MIGLSFVMLLGFQKAAKPSITFQGVQYIHRYTKGNLHEYTPKGQQDLKNWTDMVTINDYPKVKTGEGLAQSANSVLETYKANKATILNTNSVPRTEKKEAEHLVVALFPRLNFYEVSFARFKLTNGKGGSVVYSHRIYSKKAGDAMSKWLQKNGEAYEKALMAF